MFFLSSLKQYRKVTFPPKLRSKYKLATTLRVKNSRLQGCCPYRDSLTRFGGLYRIEFHKSHSGLAIGSANSVVSVIKLISYLDSKRFSFEPDLNQRPKDSCMKLDYSPPLYQLSYRRGIESDIFYFTLN